jgi:hypothetical protein
MTGRQVTQTLAVALLLLVGISAFAHRLDEYLEGTILSVGKNRLDGEITLTPGVAVFPVVMPEIDTDGDGAISETEQHAYAERVLGDLSLAIDGQTLQPHFTSTDVPPIGELKEGRGGIRIEFYADLPGGGANRKLIFENHHQSNIAAYQVNVLVPRDPAVRIVRQKRNYSQSFYQLEFVQAGVPSGARALAWLANARWPLGIGLIAGGWVALVWGLRDRTPYRRGKCEPTITSSPETPASVRSYRA